MSSPRNVSIDLVCDNRIHRAIDRGPFEVLQPCEIDLFPECYPTELIEHRFLEPFTDAVRLWTLRLCLGVVDVAERQEELVFIPFWIPTVLGVPSSRMKIWLPIRNPLRNVLSLFKLFDRLK